MPKNMYSQSLLNGAEVGSIEQNFEITTIDQRQVVEGYLQTEQDRLNLSSLQNMDLLKSHNNFGVQGNQALLNVGKKAV